MRRGRTVITGATSFVPFNVGGTAATLDGDFATGNYFGVSGTSAFTVSRTGVSTSSIYTDSAGSSYTSFPANTMRIISGSGLLVEEARTQYLGVTDAPATQTTASLGTGTYTLWVIGSGTATSSAGTATITGGGAATAGTPNTFTVTVSGTVTVTVSGSLTRFQLENGSFATSYIPNPGAAGTSAARAADVVSLQSTNFSSWYTNATAGTMFAEIQQAIRNTGVNRYIAAITDNTANNRAAMFGQTDGLSIQFRLTTGASTTFNASVGSSRPNFTVERCVMGWDAASAQAAVLNVLATEDVSVTAPTSPNRLYIGSSEAGTANFMNGYVRRVAFFPARLSNATIQALSTV
jgi:hypothetical protein